jgi:aldose 1-epimerase
MTLISEHEIIFYRSQKIVLLRITNSSGAYVEVTNYGAAITAIVVPDKYGNLGNIALHYDTLTDYFSDSFYMGCTVGRYANRISDARFSLDGEIYNLDKNDGQNSNHGGFSGFNKQVFDYKTDEGKIIFTLESPDGDGGFPGNLRINVIYSFSENNKLKIEYETCSEKKTAINITNHTYFNLAANGKDILDHHLLINAGKYLEMNDAFLPTGNILPARNTAYDFCEYQTISQMMLLKNDSLKGYNVFFIKDIDYEKPLASLWNKNSGRIVDVYTTMSGVQIYTGDFLSEPFNPFGGICLEAQYYPDGVNHQDFEACILSPDQVKRDVIEYMFSV